MPQCTTCKHFYESCFFRTHNSGKLYKTCMTCLPSYKQKKVFNETFPQATQYEVNRFCIRQKGFYNVES